LRKQDRLEDQLLWPVVYRGKKPADEHEAKRPETQVVKDKHAIMHSTKCWLVCAKMTKDGEKQRDALRT
jgi:hypothetical protein